MSKLGRHAYNDVVEDTHRLLELDLVLQIGNSGNRLIEILHGISEFGGIEEKQVSQFFVVELTLSSIASCQELHEVRTNLVNVLQQCHLLLEVLRVLRRVLQALQQVCDILDNLNKK